MSKVRGLARWSPDQHTRQIVDDIVEILTTNADELPIGVRDIEYALLDRGYRKTQAHKVGTAPSPKAKPDQRNDPDKEDPNALYNKVKDVLGRGRRAGMIPWDAISDDYFIESSPTEYEGPDGFNRYVRALAEDAHFRPLLDGQEIVPVLWCEARGMVARVKRSAHAYGVTVFASGGDDHILPKHNLAVDCINRYAHHRQRTTVLHIGDHDDKGVSIFEVLADDVTQTVADYLEPQVSACESRSAAEHLVTFHRLAVTDEQIENPRFELADKNQGHDKSGRLKVQAEAIPLDLRASLIEDAIESVLDMDLFEQTRDRSDTERATWLAATVPAVGETEPTDTEDDHAE